MHDVEVDHDGQVGVVGENVGCTGEKARVGGDFWVLEGLLLVMAYFLLCCFVSFMEFLGEGGCGG